MQVKDFENFEYRQRKPWILWVLILVVLLVAAHRLRSRRQADRKDPGDIPPDEVAGAVAVPALKGVPAATRAPAAVRETVRKLLAEARQKVNQDAYAEARLTLFEALSKAGGDRALRNEVEKLLGDLHIELVMTPRAMPEKTDYLVRSGDSVARIAQRHGTTAELVQISNRIENPNLIRAGDRLRVLNKPFTVHVNVARNELTLELDGRFFKRYPVGTGEFGRTPLGEFRINDRIPEPVWWRPSGRAIHYGDPENILGTHWLGIRATGDTEDVRGYGLHGTWDDDSIGRAESAGCVRMHNEDIEELFTMLPVGTPVTIEP